jgi:hypothetical protein
MVLMPEIDRALLPLKRRLASVTAPDPSRLGYPLFSERIADRIQRWQVERQPNPYAAVASKTDGQAYMRSLGYAVPEFYGAYPSLDALPRFDDLPDSFVLKPTGGWSAAGVFLMHRGFDLIRKRSFTRDEIIREARSFRGHGTKGLTGSWMAEELLFDYADRDEPAHDYKFFCFGPKAVLIQINKRTGLKRPASWHWFRDPAWGKIACRISWSKYPERSALPRPPDLDDMLRIVTDVGGRLNIFVRIDMFATSRGPVFGEFTAYPHAGLDYTPRGDAWLGSFWTTRDGGAQVPSAECDTGPRRTTGRISGQ